MGRTIQAQNNVHDLNRNPQILHTGLFLKTFCNTIFQRYSINKLCAFTYKTNLKSVKALESVGFNIIEEFDEDGVSSYYLEMINRLISNNQNKN